MPEVIDMGAERSLSRRASKYGTLRKKGPSIGRKKGENCVCPKCGFQEPKISNIRCFQIKCPKCGVELESD
jgi:hypothetical protein